MHPQLINGRLVPCATCPSEACKGTLSDGCLYHGLAEKVLVCLDFIGTMDKGEDQANNLRYEKGPVHGVYCIALGDRNGE